ncbi:MAG: phosphate ABC transporter, permease protein PstA [Elusimicrobia bacterium RIFCSPHIGHO2_02_FULL_61_10]|nr:MAG: phosphate ABC transporter, permease protein PstA [Elusimicrobia bacterium RIFCSPHIGHO2_02_FULL_61_10]
MDDRSYQFRGAVNRLALGMTGLCALITIGALFGLLGYIVAHGLSALNWDFFTKLPAPVGETGGGMANAIVGSFKILALASAIGVPIGFLGGVYLAEFGHGTLGFWVRYAADVLNGVPSIVMGIVAYTLVVLPMRGFSTLAGGIALGIMMIPIAVRSTEEFLRLVPQTVREAALALGIHEWKAVVFVVIPTALRGLVAGILLDLARVAGETAPLLFTALNNRVWSHGWLEPTASLPVMIFTYSIAPYDDWHRQAWAAALVLMLLVLGVNLTARLVIPHHAKST